MDLLVQLVYPVVVDSGMHFGLELALEVPKLLLVVYGD